MAFVRVTATTVSDSHFILITYYKVRALHSDFCRRRFTSQSVQRYRRHYRLSGSLGRSVPINESPLHFRVPFVLSPASADYAKRDFVFNNLGEAQMSDTKSATSTLGVLGRAMDEIAREFGVTRPDDPQRAPLLEELSALTRLRIWIESEANRTLAQPMDELARALAALKVSNRKRIHIIAEIISRSHSLNQH